MNNQSVMVLKQIVSEYLCREDVDLSCVHLTSFYYQSPRKINKVILALN
jgi:hypothetical protein